MHSAKKHNRSGISQLMREVTKTADVNGQETDADELPTVERNRRDLDRLYFSPRLYKELIGAGRIDSEDYSYQPD